MTYIIDKANRIHKKTELASKLAQRFHEDASVPLELFASLDLALRQIEAKLDATLEVGVVKTASRHPKYAKTIRKEIDELCDLLYFESSTPSTTL